MNYSIECPHCRGDGYFNDLHFGRRGKTSARKRKCKTCKGSGFIDPPFLTTAQAADLLGLDRRTMLKYIERGLIQARKFGRDWLIDPAEVERYQRERRKPGRPPKPTG